jgi:hypothetical protein
MGDSAATLSMRRFEAAMGTAFEVRPCEGDAEPIAARLVEVKARSAPPGYEQFSVLFVGPASPAWPQGTYRFVHAQLGEAELFMVPVGRRAGDSVEYEVCISRDVRADPGR